jgi:hypothetical protein
MTLKNVNNVKLDQLETPLKSALSRVKAVTSANTLKLFCPSMAQVESACEGIIELAKLARELTCEFVEIRLDGIQVRVLADDVVCNQWMFDPGRNPHLRDWFLELAGINRPLFKVCSQCRFTVQSDCLAVSCQGERQLKPLKEDINALSKTAELMGLARVEIAIG